MALFMYIPIVYKLQLWILYKSIFITFIYCEVKFVAALQFLKLLGNAGCFL